MYAVPNKASSATKISRDANYPSATKPLSKISHYIKRDKPTAAATISPITSIETAPEDANDSTILAISTKTESGAAAVGGSTSDASPGPYLAPGRQRGAWSSSRLLTMSRSGSTSQVSPKEPAAHDLQPAREPPVYECKPGEHPLQFAWTFWFMHRPPGQKIDDYEAAMIRIATFASVESFWAVYSHMKRPDKVPTITDYHMFRSGVRPVWEDSTNMHGGKWMIRLKKGLSPRLWEKLAMAVVGDVFGVGGEICGIVLSIRNSEDIISLWNKTAFDSRTNLHIRDTMKMTMGLPVECIMEYKAHNDSLKDNSSFRNTDIYK